MNYQFCDGKTEKGEKGELKKKKKLSQTFLFLDPKKKKKKRNKKEEAKNPKTLHPNYQTLGTI